MKRSVLALALGVTLIESPAFAVGIYGAPSAERITREHTLKLGGLLREGAPRTLTLKALEREGFTPASKHVVYLDESPATYSGILLQDFTERYASPTASRVRVVAVNKYEKTFPLKGWNGPEVLLALRVDGSLIPTYKRGTFRLVMSMAGLSESRKALLGPYFVWSVESFEFLP
jgi:hypothetical protein